MDNLNEIKETLKSLFRAAVNNNKEIKVNIDNEVNNDKEIKILNGIKDILTNCKKPISMEDVKVVNGLKKIFNKKEWVSKVGKDGQVYHFKIDDEETKQMKSERRDFKKNISDLKYEQNDLNGAYINYRHKNRYGRTLADPVSYDKETKNRVFNRILQDMKNSLKSDKTELTETEIAEYEKRVAPTIFSYYNEYSDEEEKYTKFYKAVEEMIKVIDLNKKIKEKTDETK